MSLVNRENHLDGLEFDQNNTFHYQIGSITWVESLSIIVNCNWDLRLNTQAPLAQLTNQTHFISALQQRRTKRTMNLHGGIYDVPANLIHFHLCALRVLCVERFYLVRPPSTFSVSTAAACAAARRAVSTRNGEHDT